ncbi:threonine/serine exporter family protein [Oscillatoria laete-virens NRMC-F 0139]|nr:threonine/serine exporter family protein [Oscillatoria laete-virens]MDL5052302.1 threonine/serine exporter family protein [Oscillatoria laete-virens NRMC-F 0139]
MSTNQPAAASARTHCTATELVDVCLLLGRILFVSGASTRRITDSIAQLVSRLDAGEAHVLVTYDALSITVNDGQGFRTKIDGRRDVSGLNISALLAVSKLLRGLDRETLPVSEIKKRLEAIQSAPPLWGNLPTALACGAVSASYCLLNGGDPVGWVGSFFGGLAIFLTRLRLAHVKVDFLQKVFLMSLVGTFIAAGCSLLMPTTTVALTTLAPVLFLVAGVPLIVGGMDIVSNHVSIGVARMTFSFAVLVAIALGIAAPFFLLGTAAATITQFSIHGLGAYILPACAGAVAAASLVVLFNGTWSILLLCAAGGMLARLSRAILTGAGLELVPATLLAALASTLFILLATHRMRQPLTSLAVICVLPMIPGYFAIESLRGLYEFTVTPIPSFSLLIVSAHNLMTALSIVLCLILGVIVPSTFFQYKLPKY